MPVLNPTLFLLGFKDIKTRLTLFCIYQFLLCKNLVCKSIVHAAHILSNSVQYIIFFLVFVCTVIQKCFNWKPIKRMKTLCFRIQAGGSSPIWLVYMFKSAALHLEATLNAKSCQPLPTVAICCH